MSLALAVSPLSAGIAAENTEQTSAPPAREIERAAVVAGSGYTVLGRVFIGESGNTSFVRLFNLSGADTTVSATLVGSPSGRNYGTTQVSVASNASVQVPVTTLMSNLGVSALISPDTRLAVYLQTAREPIAVQHVLFNSNTTFFENLTSCQASSLPNGTVAIINVHTSLFATYPSIIDIHNYGDTAAVYDLDVYNAGTGVYLGRSTQTIQPNTTFEQQFPFFEQALGIVADSTFLHANIVATPRSGSNTVTMTHTVYNAAKDAYLNLTDFCTVAPTLSGIPIANSDSQTGATVGQAFTIAAAALTANDVNATGATLSLVSSAARTNGTENGTLSLSGTTITFTPARSDTATFQYRLRTSAGDSGVGTVTVSVTNSCTAAGSTTSRTSAPVLTPPSSTTACTGGSNTNEEQYFRISPTSAGTLTLNLTGLAANANLQLYLGNNANAAVAQSLNTGTTSEQIVATVTAGDCYVRVSNTTGTQTNFTLTTALVGTCTAAGSTTSRTSGPVLTSPSTTSACIGGSSTNEEQYFRINPTGTGTLTLNLTGLSANANLQLYQGNNTNAAVAQSLNSGTTSEQISASVTATDYYVRVVNTSGTSTTFTLTTAFTPTNTITGTQLTITGATAKWEDFNQAELAIDGSSTTEYGSGGTHDFDRDTSMWWQADLGTTRTVSGLRLLWGQVGSTQDITVQGSTNGTTFTTIVSTTRMNGNASFQDLTLTGQYRYIRVNLVGSTVGGYGLSLYEAQVYGTATSSQLTITGATAKWEDVNQAEVAIDGSTTTEYGSGGTHDFARDSTMWWQADLGTSRSVARMRVLWSLVGSTQDITVQGSNNGTTFTTIVNSTRMNGNASFQELTLSGQYRYIRINLVGSTVGGYGLGMYEVQLYD